MRLVSFLGWITGEGFFAAYFLTASFGGSLGIVLNYLGYHP